MLPADARLPEPERPRDRLFALCRQSHAQDLRSGFVEERVVSPWFAKTFQEAAAASLRHPPAP